MSVDQVMKDTDHRMKAALDAMVHDFGTYRTGRANPAVLERVHVEYYGTETPLSQIANISVPEPRQLLSRAPRRRSACAACRARGGP